MYRYTQPKAKGMLQKKSATPHIMFWGTKVFRWEKRRQHKKFSIDEIVSVLTFHKYLIGQRGKY